MAHPRRGVERVWPIVGQVISGALIARSFITAKRRREETKSTAFRPALKRRKRSSVRSFSFAADLKHNAPLIVPQRISSVRNRPNMSFRTRSGLRFSFRRRKRRRTMKLASRVSKLEKKRDVKMVDADFTQTNIVLAGFMRSLCDIPQGDFSNQRDGDHVFPFRFKFRCHWIGKVLSVNEVYRVIIFRDRRQVTSVVPLLLDVLKVAHPMSQYRASTRTRWKILVDQTFSPSSNDAALASSWVLISDVKLTQKLSFEGAGQASWSNNGIFALFVTNLAANAPDIFVTSRVLYND